MVKGKWIRVSLVVGLSLLIGIMMAGNVFSSGKKTNPTKEAGYVGSNVCMGCHTQKHDVWSESGHGNMVVRVFKTSDLPKDPATAPEEFRADLNRAAYIVGGKRFIARDPKTGQLTLLSPEYDKVKGDYVKYSGAGNSWENMCAGCHTTGLQKDKDITGVETGIGCEACHGPGRAHIEGRGDRSKIVVNTEAITCGRCHNRGTGPNGMRWPVGWKPGMTVEETGWTMTQIKPGEVATAIRQFVPFQASKHAVALKSIEGRETPACYVCHSAEAKIAKEKGTPITDVAKLKSLKDNVSCVACHDSHGPTEHGAQLRESPKTLCMSCHTRELPEGGSFKAGGRSSHAQKEFFKGYGAVGVPQTKGLHTAAVTCIDCHMSGNNHQFKVILPAAVKGTTKKDSCTTCHVTSSATIRGAYLGMWQRATKEKLDAVKPLLEMAEAKVKATPALDANLVESVKATRTNVNFVESDGSMGVHNFEYAMTILEKAETDLLEFGKATQ